MTDSFAPVLCRADGEFLKLTPWVLLAVDGQRDRMGASPSLPFTIVGFTTVALGRLFHD